MSRILQSARDPCILCIMHALNMVVGELLQHTHSNMRYHCNKIGLKFVSSLNCSNMLQCNKVNITTGWVSLLPRSDFLYHGTELLLSNACFTRLRSFTQGCSVLRFKVIQICWFSALLWNISKYEKINFSGKESRSNLFYPLGMCLC